MPHQDKPQKCYLDLGINLEWPDHEHTKFLRRGLSTGGQEAMALPLLSKVNMGKLLKLPLPI